MWPETVVMPSTLEVLGGAAVATVGAYAIYKATRPKIGECCPGQSAGFLPQDPNYSPKGEMKDLGGGRMAYVVGSGTEAVAMLHDVFGVHTGRHKQMADEIASRGFLVVIPDFFQAARSGLFGTEDLGYGTSLSTLARFMYALASGRMKGFMRAHPRRARVRTPALMFRARMLHVSRDGACATMCCTHVDACATTSGRCSWSVGGRAGQICDCLAGVHG